MKIVAIVQSRMGSTRLPGKVLMSLGGATVLARVINRLRQARLINAIIVATTIDPIDDAIVHECKYLNVKFFRGSEHDVLDRYYQAALTSDSDVIVRITSDCPLIDPALVDQAIRVFAESNADYVNNVTPRTYPRGLDVEVIKMSALQQAWKDSHLSYEREHVTPYLYQHPELFRLSFQTGSADYSAHRWTLDTAEDFEMLTALYAKLDDKDNFTWEDVISIMEQEPQLAAINAHIIQKPLNPR